MFAPPQFRHRRLVAREASQVVSPQALEGNNPPLTQGVDRLRQRVIGCNQSLVCVESLQPGSTRRAGDWLRMESTVARILILRAALRAHDERFHRRPLSVVGGIPDDREAGAAVGAVQEGISVPPVTGIEQFGQAVVAGGDVRRGKNQARGVVGARLDPKASVILRKTSRPADLVELRQRWRPFQERGQEAVDESSSPSTSMRTPPV